MLAKQGGELEFLASAARVKEAWKGGLVIQVVQAGGRSSADLECCGQVVILLEYGLGLEYQGP